jgi:hypothetical protein
MERNTPLFRVAVSLVALWMVAAVAYGLHGSTFYNYTYQRGWESIEASCDHLIDDERSVCVASKVVVGDGPFWRGNPLWQIFKFLLLPPILLLGTIWLWPEISSGSRRLAGIYARWVKGNATPPSP